ncbi:MAG: phosphoenolpyruvate synthase [Prevotellaceae bacterium]|jgi:DNA-binding response OmpR family regulator|nr:phosphoenolpyruvate synthase [Prevotellaceae bacterium]
MSGTHDFKKVAFKDTSFADLMNKRIFNVLLIASKYDAFMLEDDGRVDEQIFNEYTALSLRYPPRFTEVSTKEDALKELSERAFELIIFMPNLVDSDIFIAAKDIKVQYPSIPIVVLTPFSKEVSQRVANEDLSAIDYIFSWLGNSELLLAIIKLIEDKMNAPYDTASVGVQIILLVEDSIRFYSSALSHLYKFVLEQSKQFAKEALNAHQQTLRMRGRPKILLARTYEEAMQIYSEYSNNILGIISDMSFSNKGKKDTIAGYRFGKYIREKSGITTPIIIESSESVNVKYARKLNASFIDKNSKSYPQDLRKTVMERFGFGDFVIINPDTQQEIMRITDLKDLQNKIFQIPDDSLKYHFSKNHFSRFFYSRAMFPPAELLRPMDISAYNDINEARQFIFDVIVQYRLMKNSGIVAVYKRERFDEYSNFARIGDGSLGGKGRGLAFIGAMIKRYPKLYKENFSVNIPKTVVLCTDIFDEFMESNNLYNIALSNMSDEVIFEHFINAKLPEQLFDDITAFLNVIKRPVAVRSSSLLEDAYYQPFAGVYSTYMLPNLGDKNDMLRIVCDAIKGVYASVFFKESKTYMTATSNIIDQEKMAIVLQEVVGVKFDKHLYPLISGVARSLNFYPIGNEKPDEGIVNIALGLGKYIVDGGNTIRFSPVYPRNVLQMSSVKFALRDTQSTFFALDLENMPVKFSANDSFNLLKLSIEDADRDGALNFIASTYDYQNEIVRPGYYPQGRKIISFANILEHDLFPLAETLKLLLEIGQKEMGRPIELEFAVNIHPGNRNNATLYLLQIRPVVDQKEIIDDDLTKIAHENLLMISNLALGHGISNDVHDVLYVKSASFDSAKTRQIADEIEKINSEFVKNKKYYILVGPGRWGSSDPWLGIPIKWAHICNARVITECSLQNYQIGPSQGTHFFQNLTSCGAGYFTINPPCGDGFFDEDFLNSQTAAVETEFLRLIHFDSHLTIKIDGSKGVGIVTKPQS